MQLHPSTQHTTTTHHPAISTLHICTNHCYCYPHCCHRCPHCCRSSSGRRRLKPKVDGDAAAGGYGSLEDAGDDSGSDGGQQDIASLFDYELYFPTTLPVSLHHPCDKEADAAADAAVMRRGLPVELALKEVKGVVVGEGERGRGGC